jgi:hypothetical protein
MARELNRERVWRYIKAQERNVTSADLQREFDMSHYTARYYLCTLRRMGALKHLGKTRDSEYKVIRPKLDIGDRRGTNANSLRNLRHVMTSSAMTKRTKDKPSADWQGATELEKMWAFPQPFVGRDD